MTVRATDSGGLTFDRSFLLTVRDVNEAPVATADQFNGLQLDDIIAGGLGIIANDSDVDGDVLTAMLVSGPTHGSLILQSDGTFVYTSNPDFYGEDVFAYYVSDGLLNSGVVSVKLVVQQTVTNTGTPTPPPVISVINTGGDDVSGDEDPIDIPGSGAAGTGDPNTPTVPSAPSDNQSQSAAGDNPDLMPSGPSQSTARILEQTGSEFCISVFLVDVPEQHTETSDHRTGLRTSDEATSSRVQTGSDFLFSTILTNTPLFSGLDFNLEDKHIQQHQQRQEQRQEIIEKVVVGTTAAVSTSVSVGYVVWVLRGGSLLTTFLSSMPAWQAFDPLPVLESFEDEDDLMDEESLAEMVSGEKS